MTFLARLSLSLILAGGALVAHAAAPAAVDPAARAVAIADFHAARIASAAPKVGGDNPRPGTPKANPLRAYPPSCGANPLPDKVSDPKHTRRVVLFKTNYTRTIALTEEVTITLWRIACSSSGSATAYNPTGGKNAMTLMRIDRDEAFEGNSNAFPTFPYVLAKQGNIDFDDFEARVRAVAEPDTITSDVSFDTPIIDSTTYVLENYGYEDAGYFKFNEAFQLRAQPLLPNYTPPTLELPAYQPTEQTYPDAFAPLPLDGYAAAQWVNYDLNQGLLLQVTEQVQPNGTMVRQVVFDLLLEDANGDPLWLIGNAAFPVNARSVEVQLAYLGNGLAQVPWGTATLSVAHCNRLDVDYAGRDDLEAHIPTFDGITSYGRLFTPNGMTCE
ncbi:MAG TPA: hypothetical protein VIZ64_00745 [Dokdonella sp.]